MFFFLKLSKNSATLRSRKSLQGFLSIFHLKIFFGIWRSGDRSVGLFLRTKLEPSKAGDSLSGKEQKSDLHTKNSAAAYTFFFFSGYLTIFPCEGL